MGTIYKIARNNKSTVSSKITGCVTHKLIINYINNKFSTLDTSGSLTYSIFKKEEEFCGLKQTSSLKFNLLWYLQSLNIRKMVEAPGKLKQQWVYKTNFIILQSPCTNVIYFILIKNYMCLHQHTYKDIL